MRKIYLCLWVVMLTYFNFHQARSQSFSADFETSPSASCGPSPAVCTNFVQSIGGVNFVFTFQADGDGGNMQHLPANGGVNGSGSMDLQSDAYNINTTEKVTIARQDGQSFRLEGLYVQNDEGQLVTVQPYLAGSPVGTAQTVSRGDKRNLTYASLTVDKVQLSSTDFFYISFDAFKGSICVTPTAVADSYATNEDTPLVVTLVSAGILANDSNVDASSAVLVSGPDHGSLTLNANGTFTYTPDANYFGTDGFTYKAGSAGCGQTSATAVTISINSANDAPVLADIADKTVSELTLLSFSVSASDPDAGQALTYQITAGAQPGMSLNASTGAFTWTPTETQGPSDYPLTIRATDNGSPNLSDSKSFTIHVDDNTDPTLTYLTVPGNGTSNVPLVTGLYANFVPGATTYFFEINTDAAFNAATAIIRTSSSRYVALNSGVLQYATTYYVRVRTNFAPTWGTVNSFSTIPAPSGRMQAATESTVSSECQVWPNPFAEKLNVLVNSPQPEPLELQLSDLQGRIIHQSASYWTNEANHIGENLPAGIYILQARWGNETKIVKVFKQR